MGPSTCKALPQHEGLLITDEALKLAWERELLLDLLAANQVVLDAGALDCVRAL